MIRTGCQPPVRASATVLVCCAAVVSSVHALVSAQAGVSPEQAQDVVRIVPQEPEESAPESVARESRLPGITLDEVLRKAQSDPPAVLTARAALQRAQAERSLAKGAWLPSLVGRASYGYAYDNRLVLPDTPRINSESLEARGSLSMEWSALDVARGARIDAASAGERAASLGLQSAQQSAMLAAAEMFFYASAAGELVEDAALSLRRRTQQQRATHDLVEAGTRSPVDVQRAHIEVVSARYMLQERKREEMAALSALAAALGRKPDALLRPVVDGMPEPSARDAAQLVEVAQAHRPELLQAKAQLEAARRRHDAALSERMPTLGAIAMGSISYLDVRRGQGIDGHQFDGSVSVVLRFQGLDPAVWLKADAEEAAAAQAERTRAQLAHRVGAEAISAEHAWQRARIELQRAVAVLEAAQVAREAQNGRYLAGLSSLLELLDAEDLEQQARQRRIEARRDEAIAVVRLHAACGLLGR